MILSALKINNKCGRSINGLKWAQRRLIIAKRGDNNGLSIYLPRLNKTGADNDNFVCQGLVNMAVLPNSGVPM